MGKERKPRVQKGKKNSTCGDKDLCKKCAHIKIVYVSFAMTLNSIGH